MKNSKGETFVALSQENYELKERIAQLEAMVAARDRQLMDRERERQTLHQSEPLQNLALLQDASLLQDTSLLQDHTRVSSQHYTNTVIKASTQPHLPTTPPNRPARSKRRPSTPLSTPPNSPTERNTPPSAGPTHTDTLTAHMRPRPDTPPHPIAPITTLSPSMRPFQATPPSSASPDESTLMLHTKPHPATPTSIMSSEPMSLPPTPPPATPPGPLPHEVRAQRTISLKWQPERCVGTHMVRGSSAYNLHYTEVYLSSPHSQHIHSYCTTTGQWARYQPKCPHLFFGMTVALGLITTVGGQQGKTATPTLLSLLDREGEGVDWCELFPPMPTPRLTPTVTTLAPGTTEERVLVIGGVAASGDPLPTVEILHIQSRQWSSAASLPYPADMLSCSMAGTQLYLMGGSKNKHVYTSSVQSLLQSTASHTTTGIWLRLPDTPTNSPSGITIENQLLAVGGYDDKGVDSAGIFHFQPDTNSWKVISHMNRACNKPLLSNQPRGTLMVMGGSTKVNHITNVVQTAEVSCAFEHFHQ